MSKHRRKKNHKRRKKKLRNFHRKLCDFGYVQFSTYNFPNSRQSFNINEIVYVKYNARIQPTSIKECFYQIKMIGRFGSKLKYTLKDINGNAIFTEKHMLIKINNADQEMFKPILDTNQLLFQNI